MLSKDERTIFSFRYLFCPYLPLNNTSVAFTESQGQQGFSKKNKNKIAMDAQWKKETARNVSIVYARYLSSV